MYIWVNPEIPQNTRHTRKYQKEKKIPRNIRSYFWTLLPDPNPTRYPVFCPIPDPAQPDVEKPYPLGTACLMSTNWSTGLRRVGRAGPTPAEEQLHILRNLDKEVLEESRRMGVEEAKGA